MIRDEKNFSASGGGGNLTPALVGGDVEHVGVLLEHAVLGEGAAVAAVVAWGILHEIGATRHDEVLARLAGAVVCVALGWGLDEAVLPKDDGAVGLCAKEDAAIVRVALDGGVGKHDRTGVHVKAASAAVVELERGVGYVDRAVLGADRYAGGGPCVCRDVGVHDVRGALDGHARSAVCRRVDREVGAVHVQPVHIEGLAEAPHRERGVLEVEVEGVEPGARLRGDVDRAVLEGDARRIEVGVALVVGSDCEPVPAGAPHGSGKVDATRAACAGIVLWHVRAVGDSGALLGRECRLEACHRELSRAGEGGPALEDDAVDAGAAAADGGSLVDDGECLNHLAVKRGAVICVISVGAVHIHSNQRCGGGTGVCRGRLFGLGGRRGCRRLVALRRRRSARVLPRHILRGRDVLVLLARGGAVLRGGAIGVGASLSPPLVERGLALRGRKLRGAVVCQRLHASHGNAGTKHKHCAHGKA